MPPPPARALAIDVGRTDELIEAALKGSRDYLDALERGEARAPFKMTMHGHRRPLPLLDPSALG